MSLYRDAIGISSAPGKLAKAVKVTAVIRTPAGPVIAGEIVEGHYLSAGEAAGYQSTNDVGWGFKSLARGLGRGVVKLADPRTHLKVAKFATKTTLKASDPRTHFRVVRGTSKLAFQGTRGAINYARKNPLKTLAIAALPGAGLAYMAYKGSQSDSSSPAPALPPTSSAATPLLPAMPSASAAPSAPGSPNQPTQTTPNVLAPPKPSFSPGEHDDDDEGGSQESADDADAQDAQGSDDGGGDADAADDDNVQGEPNMPSEEYVGLDEIGAEEEVSGEEWVGADEISGARRPARRPAPRPPAPGQVRVKSGGYTKHRRQYLPVASSGAVAAGASATITVAPQTLFRGRRLVVPSAIAAAFVVDDIKVGNTSQGAAAGSVPAEAFIPTATGEDNLQMDTASPGKTVTLLVTNVSGSAVNFRAVIFGDSVM
jgi:hypothetical protein